MNDELKGLQPVRAATRPGVMYHSLDDPDRYLQLATSRVVHALSTVTLSNTYLYYEVIGGYIDVRCVKVVLART